MITYYLTSVQYQEKLSFSRDKCNWPNSISTLVKERSRKSNLPSINIFGTTQTPNGLIILLLKARLDLHKSSAYDSVFM